MSAKTVADATRVSALLLLCLTSACVDRRAEIATALVYPEKNIMFDQASNAALNAAFNSRFPRGSSFKGLQAFVGRLGGNCRPNNDSFVGEESYNISCFMQDYVVPGFGAGIGIDVFTEQDIIQRLRAWRSGAGF